MNDLPAILANNGKEIFLLVVFIIRLKVTSRMPCPKVPNACVEVSGMNLVGTSFNQQF